MITYLSVCSGIEAASVAWEPFGFEPVAFSEVASFPAAVLSHRFPHVPNVGDMTNFEEWNLGPVDLLVGGTPCQSFSVAGLRGGLEDDRGNLALTYCRILQRLKPRWFVWENVPGVLSSNGGRDFGSILGAMAELGYGIAYRILDAQYFGVPQRRRRVFVVGCAGDWRRAAEVLFEPGCLSGDSKKGRKARQAVAALTANGVGTCGADDNQGQAGHHLIAHALRGEEFDASEDGTGGGTPLVAVPSITSHYGKGVDSDCTAPLVSSFRTSGNCGAWETGSVIDALTTGTDRSSHLLASTGNISHCLNAGGMGRQDYETETLIAFSGRDRGDDGRGYGREPNVTGSITETVDATKPPRVAGPATGVRRLTPRECERLQGFPDDWTLVPHRGKPAADGPRYKAIGNSMAVPVMRWIGKRIVEAMNG